MFLFLLIYENNLILPNLLVIYIEKNKKHKKGISGRINIKMALSKFKTANPSILDCITLYIILAKC
jgi:hypothetical protein